MTEQLVGRTFASSGYRSWRWYHQCSRSRWIITWSGRKAAIPRQVVESVVLVILTVRYPPRYHCSVFPKSRFQGRRVPRGTRHSSRLERSRIIAPSCRYLSEFQGQLPNRSHRTVLIIRLCHNTLPLLLPSPFPPSPVLSLRHHRMST